MFSRIGSSIFGRIYFNSNHFFRFLKVLYSHIIVNDGIISVPGSSSSKKVIVAAILPDLPGYICAIIHPETGAQIKSKAGPIPGKK